MKCDHCQGSGQRSVFACPGFRWKTTACSVCQGSRDLSEARGQELARAEALRQYRLRLRLSCHQFAQAHGLDPVTYNDMEHGREPISAELVEKMTKGGAPS